MQPADPDAFAGEQVAEHPAAGERQFQMQLVDTAHECEIGVGNLPWSVVDRASADPQLLGLQGDRQVV